jgi:hypothetical protein
VGNQDTIHGNSAHSAAAGDQQEIPEDLPHGFERFAPAMLEFQHAGRVRLDSQFIVCNIH